MNAFVAILIAVVVLIIVFVCVKYCSKSGSLDSMSSGSFGSLNSTNR